MSFIASHPTGNSFVKALVEELYRQDKLKYFSTTIGFGYGTNFFFSKFKNKRKYNIPDTKVKRHWNPEIKRLLIRSDQKTNRLMADASYNRLDLETSKKLSTNSAKFIHAYEDCACKTFTRAKELGIQCSYELPITHWATTRKLLAEEAERYPEWEPTLESTNEPEEKLFQKEEELSLADRIICPSQFVFNSIPPVIRNRIPSQIIPFGSPVGKFNTHQSNKRFNDPFKILFVGSMSQRKGLADLFEAMKLLKKESVKLSVLGQLSMPMDFYRRQFSEFEYIPPCANHFVREIMKKHDVLVLPSIIEGRALVQQEALSCGIPLVVTPNAGGTDLIIEGITGYLIPIRSPEEIAKKIISLKEIQNSRKDLALSCIEKANSYSWTDYANRIIDFNLKPFGNL